MDVSNGVNEVTVAPARSSLMPFLKDAAASTKLPVHPRSVFAKKKFEDIRERRFNRFDQEVNVIRHQAVCIEKKGHTLLDDQEIPEEPLPHRIIQEDRSASDAARRNVDGNAGTVNAQASSHTSSTFEDTHLLHKSI